MTAPVKDAFVWVAGGRDYTNELRIHNVLTTYSTKHGIETVITGAAPGADLIAEAWARKSEIPYIGVPAKWTEQGKAAGPIRNELIARCYKPDVLIAFPGGTGTEDAIQKARERNIPVFEIDREAK